MKASLLHKLKEPVEFLCLLGELFFLLSCHFICSCTSSIFRHLKQFCMVELKSKSVQEVPIS